MTVTLAKASDKIVSSVALVEGVKIKGVKSVFSIRLETWKNGNSSEVRVVVRDQDGKFHGATNFRQNVMLDITNLINGTHSNRRKK